MGKNYQWKTDATIISGGYPDEETGIINGSTDWHTTDVLTGSTSAEYYFRDSASSSNNNSSRVVVSITESWVASINSRNYLTVTMTTTVNSIRRDDLRGSPGAGGSPYRDMYMRREAGGAIIWQVEGDDIRTDHTILSSPLVLDTYTFTIAPGENFSRGSIHFRSNVAGHGDDPAPSIYVDEMWLGTNFRNILPKDYRPGCVLSGGEWLSHNRDAGTCHILHNGSWQEMRTVGGPTEMGDTPSVYTNNKWYNMNQIGSEN